MKNEETGRISYYTSKKEVVYTSPMMYENAPLEWLYVPEENIKRFQQSIRYKRADDRKSALEKFKITFQKQRLWNEVLKIEKNADARLERSFELYETMMFLLLWYSLSVTAFQMIQLKVFIY